MKKLIISLLVFACVASFQVNNIEACSFVFDSKLLIVGRTMDFYEEDGAQIYIFPRGTVRNGPFGDSFLPVKDNLKKWTSLYGSLMITLFKTKDMAVEGMNEKGLAVYLLYMKDTEYPSDKSYPCVVTWVQYLLDNSGDVEEAIEKMKDIHPAMIRVGKNKIVWPLHMAIVDSTGDSAIIEFIKGKMVIHHNFVSHDNRVMTNEPDYDTQIANLKNYNLLQLDKKLLNSYDSQARFVKATAFLMQKPPQRNIMDIMNLMKCLSVKRIEPFDPKKNEWPTRWISAYNLQEKKFYFSSVTVEESGYLKTNNNFWIDLNKLNIKNGDILNLSNPYAKDLKGDITNNLKPVR